MKKKLLCLLSLMTSVYGLSGSADTTKIKDHLMAMTKAENARNFQNIERLNEVADYIFTHFASYADTTYYQEFEVGKNTYKNVIGVFGNPDAETIVIGAHYDVCGNQEGADDNATGVVGLMELARLLADDTLAYRVELVAYTLEEPPFFRSENMGSYVHAKSLMDHEVPVFGMICLEMIGYFDDAKGSQDYPIGALKAIYGSRGNYITLVNQFGKGKFARQFSRFFKREDLIRTKKFTGPKQLPGIDFSDHLNYWRWGISALMITDTAFYRNKNYHQSTDTMEKLDLGRMKSVIDTVYQALLAMNA